MRSQNSVSLVPKRNFSEFVSAEEYPVRGDKSHLSVKTFPMFLVFKITPLHHTSRRRLEGAKPAALLSQSRRRLADGYFSGTGRFRLFDACGP
jgi:hypothetical protein